MVGSGTWRLGALAPPEREPAAPEGAPAELDDAALVARAREDPAAFAPLYARYLDPVYRYCHRRLGDREAAEDATGRVFTQALAALPRYREGGAFRAWLFAIAHNAIADAGRARARVEVCAGLDAAADLTDGDPTPEEAALAAEAGDRLSAVLAELTPDGRRVVELRLAGLTGPEIARALGKRHGAVKVAQFRAFARLRALLADPPDPASEENRHGPR